MKKKLMLFLCCIFTISLCSCGKTSTEESSTVIEINNNEDESVIKKLYEKGTYDTIVLDDYITLGDYSSLTNLEYEKVTDTMISSELESYLNSNISVEKITNRPIEEGDSFVFNLTINDITYESMQYSVGSNIFGEQFNSEVLGMKANEEKTFKTKINSESGFSEYSDGETEVTVSILYIAGEAIVPELNDEFIVSLTNGDYKNIDDFKEYIKEYLEENNKINAVYDNFWVVMDNSSFKNIDNLIESQYNYLQEYYKNYAEENFITYDELYSAYGFETIEAFEQQLKTDSEDNVKQRLVIYALANAENITLNDDDYTNYCKELVSNYGYTSMTDLINSEELEGLRYYCVLQKVIEYFSK